MTTVINLLGAPGAGKSILAYDLCSLLRKNYVVAELVTEAAKDRIYEGHDSSSLDQLEIFAEQYRRVKRLNGKVDYVITDSPLFLSAYYSTKIEYPRSFVNYSLDIAKSFENVNFLIKRNHKYDTNGRSQTEAESDVIHEELKDFCWMHNIMYHQVLAHDGLAVEVEQRLRTLGVLL